jgi:hypothetical protein
MDPGDREAHFLGVLQALRPSPEALLDLLRPQIDDAMLEEMSKMDYGDSAGEHLQALREIRDRRRVFAPMEWVPQEALELTRWIEPEDPGQESAARGIRDHRMRAFACAVLLRASAEPENKGFFLGEDKTAARLVASGFALGPDVQEATVKLLAWSLIRRHLSAEDRPIFALAVLLLDVRLFKEGDDPRRLIDLCTFVDWELERIEGHPLEAQIIRTTREWRLLIKKVLLEPDQPHPPEAKGDLKRIGGRFGKRARSTDGG